MARSRWHGLLMTKVDSIVRVLTERGMLLKQDKSVPNVVSLITGESLRTSWWSHPKARDIFVILSSLADHPDVVVTKLLFGKDTFVHRALWPALLAVALAREPWQLARLSDAARALLDEIDRSAAPVLSHGAPAKLLEIRLLVHAEEVHTASGRHQTALERWQSWSIREQCDPHPSRLEACSRLEAAARSMGAPRSALPWPETP